MAYTRSELGKEFWMLTEGILQDSKVDAEEAQVILRWLEEHRTDASFDILIEKLRSFLKDGYVDPYESKAMITSLGNVLRTLRAPAQNS